MERLPLSGSLFLYYFFINPELNTYIYALNVSDSA